MAIQDFVARISRYILNRVHLSNSIDLDGGWRGVYRQMSCGWVHLDLCVFANALTKRVVFH